MYRVFYPIARKLWPDLENMTEQRRLVGTGDVGITLLTAPLALAGIIWLASITDLNLIRVEWPLFLLFGVSIFIFNRVNYFIIVEIRTDRYGSADGSLASMVQWSAVFILGPTALWLQVLWSGINFALRWRRTYSAAAHWGQLRGFCLDQTGNTLSYLIALSLYYRLGGAIPLSSLALENLLPALAALVLQFSMVVLSWIAYIYYAIWVQQALTRSTALEPIMKFLLLALGLPFLAHPFAILLAGLYIENGLLIYIFFAVGLLLVAYLARQLSWAAESSRQQSRQLEQLEHLGREIINSPPDASTLPSILEEHVPAMFPSARVMIWLSPDDLLFKNPPDWALEIGPICQWVSEQTDPHTFLAREPLPWETHAWSGSVDAHDPVVTAPIFAVESTQAIGCIYIELRSLAQPWDRRALASLFPAAKSLAAQVASALHQAQVYEETLAYQQSAQELEFAGKIQSSFLPNEMPRLNGWELAVTLLPARETSGDYFDFIPLQDGKIGILIADVADKGVGAALYMALSRTLIRTFALEYVDSQPDIVLFSANERILRDARANLFVTAFYGILDQEEGTLTYCNAGHNSPYLLSPKDGGKVTALSATGMPIGIEEDVVWTQNVIQIEPGDVLLFYTDGIPDAQNNEGLFFKEERLVEVAKANLGLSAQEMQIAILDEVQKFVNNAPQFDDITLLVLIRNP